MSSIDRVHAALPDADPSAHGTCEN